MTARLRFATDNLLGSRRGGLSVPLGSGLDPLLAEAVVLLRASALNPAMYTSGDPWPNEGTAGSAYNGVAVGTPVLGADPEPGFELGGADGVGPYWTIANGAAILPGTSSFSRVWRGYWAEASPSFEGVVAHYDGSIGSTAHGYYMGSGTAVNGGFALIEDGAALALAIDSGDLVPVGERVLGMVVNRDDDTIKLYVDGAEVASGDASGVTDVSPSDGVILGRGDGAGGEAAPTIRDLLFYDRALTGAEMASLVDLLEV